MAHSTINRRLVQNHGIFHIISGQKEKPQLMSKFIIPIKKKPYFLQFLPCICQDCYNRIGPWRIFIDTILVMVTCAHNWTLRSLQKPNIHCNFRINSKNISQKDIIEGKNGSGEALGDSKIKKVKDNKIILVSKKYITLSNPLIFNDDAIAFRESI